MRRQFIVLIFGENQRDPEVTIAGNRLLATLNARLAAKRAGAVPPLGAPGPGLQGGLFDFRGVPTMSPGLPSSSPVMQTLINTINQPTAIATDYGGLRKEIHILMHGSTYSPAEQEADPFYNRPYGIKLFHMLAAVQSLQRLAAYHDNVAPNWFFWGCETADRLWWSDVSGRYFETLDLARCAIGAPAIPAAILGAAPVRPLENKAIMLEADNGHQSRANARDNAQGWNMMHPPNMPPPVGCNLGIRSNMVGLETPLAAGTVQIKSYIESQRLGRVAANLHAWCMASCHINYRAGAGNAIGRIEYKNPPICIQNPDPRPSTKYYNLTHTLSLVNNAVPNFLEFCLTNMSLPGVQPHPLADDDERSIRESAQAHNFDTKLIFEERTSLLDLLTAALASGYYCGRKDYAAQNGQSILTNNFSVYGQCGPGYPEAAPPASLPFGYISRLRARQYVGSGRLGGRPAGAAAIAHALDTACTADWGKNIVCSMEYVVGFE